MPLFIWVALGISVAAVLASALFALSRGLAAWRAFRRLRRKVFEALGDLEQRAGGIEERLDRIGTSTERLSHASAGLQESLATAGILAAAFGDARAAVTLVTGLVP